MGSANIFAPSGTVADRSEIRNTVVRLGASSEPWQHRAVAALREVPGLGPVEVVRDPGAAGEFVVDLVDSSAAAGGSGRLVIQDEHGLGPNDLAAEAIRRGQRSLVVRLIHVSAEGARTVLEEGSLKVTPWSWRASRRRLLAEIASWPARVLAGRTSLGRSRPAPPHAPAVGRLTRHWRRRVAELRNLAREVALATLDEQWSIGVIEAPAHKLLGGIAPGRVRWLDPLPGGYLADPIALPEVRPRLILLAEAYRFDERCGKVAVVHVGKEGSTTAIVLDRPWHLSYPFLWREGEQIWCIPEMAEAGRVQLFRADPFPDRWIEGPVLLEGFAGVDPTLHHDGQRYWLFCADRTDAPNAKLFLFHSERLEEVWQPHPCNPIRCDLRNSRPAGPLFTHEGHLYRPAQDCSLTYGGGLAINRILELTPTTFREEIAVRLVPDPRGPYPDGLHTFCAAGPVTIIDGKRHFRSLSRLIARARKLPWSA
jgi:hypothetical protein